MNSKVPLIILAATPLEKVSADNFFSEDSNFFRLMKDPPYLRYMGWNMLTLDYPKIIDGLYWEVKNGDRKTARLYKDGSFVTFAYADNSFLGWGKSDEDFAKFPKLNTLALIEYVYEFTELYRNFLTQFEGVRQVRFKIGIKNSLVGDKPLYLTPTKVNDFLYSFENNPGELKKDFLSEITIDIDKGNVYDSERVAFQLLSEIFVRFNISSDKIPYAVEENNIKKISAEEIKKS